MRSGLFSARALARSLRCISQGGRATWIRFWSLPANIRLKVIEDCAQAHGATYKGRPVGSMGDANAFSFCQDKIMTTGGEGGMLTTNDTELWSRAWAFKDHGKNYDAVYRREHPPGYRWLHESVGTNWRMTEMQSAMGRVLLRKLPQSVHTRRSLAGLLAERFSRMPALRVTRPPDHSMHSFYKYYVFVRPERLREGWDRQRVVDAVNAEGVPCFVGSCSEIYLEGVFPAELRPPEQASCCQGARRNRADVSRTSDTQ